MARQYVAFKEYLMYYPSSYSLNICFYGLYYLFRNIFGATMLDSSKVLYGGSKNFVAWFDDHIAIVIEDVNDENTGYGYVDYFIVGEKDNFDPTDSSTYLKRIQLMEYIGMGKYIGITPQMLDLSYLYIGYVGEDQYYGVPVKAAYRAGCWVIFGRYMICKINSSIYYVRSTMRSNDDNYFAVLKDSSNNWIYEKPDYAKLMIFHDYKTYNYFNSTNGIYDYTTGSLVETPVMFLQSPIMFISEHMNLIGDPVPNDYVYQGYVHEERDDTNVKLIISNEYGEIEVEETNDYFIYSPMDYYIRVDMDTHSETYVVRPGNLPKDDCLISPNEFLLISDQESLGITVANYVAGIVGGETKCLWGYDRSDSGDNVITIYIAAYENGYTPTRAYFSQYNLSEMTYYNSIIHNNKYYGYYNYYYYVIYNMFGQGEMLTPSTYGTPSRIFYFTLNINEPHTINTPYTEVNDYSWQSFILLAPAKNKVDGHSIFADGPMAWPLNPGAVGWGQGKLCTFTKVGYDFATVNNGYNVIPDYSIIDDSDLPSSS